MIKVKLENEIERRPESTIIFNFRRHEQSDQPKNQEKLYLTMRQENGAPSTLEYPIRIDGTTKTVTIRTRIFEKYGFFIKFES